MSAFLQAAAVFIVTCSTEKARVARPTAPVLIENGSMAVGVLVFTSAARDHTNMNLTTERVYIRTTKLAPHLLPWLLVAPAAP